MGLLHRIFGTKKQSVNSDRSGSKSGTQKRRWSFVKSSKDKSQLTMPCSSRFNGSDNSFSFSDVIGRTLDANKHAIAVAAATAAVAEAALAAAHAAAEVVRLTSGAGTSVPRYASFAHVSNSQRVLFEEIAAVKIQSAFRGYLARRALRALKALVKLQALVRGHIVRKKTADMLRRMQTLVRLQSRARASRMSVTETLHSRKSSLSHNHIPLRNDHWEHPYRTHGNKFEGTSVSKSCSSNTNFREIDAGRTQLDTNWLDRWMEENLWTHRGDASLKTKDDKSDKILEVDTWKPRLNFQPSNNSFHSYHPRLASDYKYENVAAAYDSPSKPPRKQINPSLSSMDAPDLSYLNFPKGKDEAAMRTAENSPTFSALSRPGSGERRSPFTLTRSEYSWGCFNGYSGHPNYMANTESSRAKTRSLSAPRQRFEFESSGSTRRSIQGSLDAGVSLDMDADFKTKDYPTSSHFSRLGSTNLR